MKRTVCPRLAGAISIVALLLAANLLSQSNVPDPKVPAAGNQTAGGASQPSSNSSTLRVTTRMVVVDVVAVDKKGQPVNDLEATDFALREDGREQPISTFNFQHPGTATPARSDGGPLPPNLFRNRPKYQSSGALNVILIDALNSTLPHQAYVRSEMVHFL